ncbi:DUF5987 family protein [Actinomycetospora atypica]|uniref:DUF5987 family protein n=1 Tax=Actinomycetospora atypica TaxID=1290095 RepID=A0ABV9YMV8_9PSEU
MDIPRDPVTMTLEAFADTVLPGRKRGPEDPAVVGVSDTPGAVEAGALTLMYDEATGLAEGLPFLAPMLDGHAAKYAGERDIVLDGTLPAFVALAYDDRAALLESLTRPGHPEREVWVGLFMFANMAFDSAAHLPTLQALAEGHPGLRAMGIATPDADGLWRFPAYSYRRVLADLHPDTTPSGSPA